MLETEGKAKTGRMLKTKSSKAKKTMGTIFDVL
jgi:hypothetical protein